ncbi:MAG: leucine-rich repeat domain-containing protein, partial [Thermoguttaceae bacterium]|nr:leucine-rich repeat domain-containing protein [Thermoguttaceae bacterium]
ALGEEAARRAASVQTTGEEGAFAYETEGFSATITGLLDKTATEAVVPEKIGGRRVTKIGAAAFADCAALTEIKLPQGVREIGSNAFSGCVSLKTITLPASLEALRSGFDGCSALTEIAVAPNNKAFRSVDGVLFSLDGRALLRYPLGKTATEYAIPDGTERVAASAFRDCAALTAITFPASVRELGGEALLGCVALRSVALPDGLATIPSSAFLGCSALAEIKFPKGLKAIAPHAFIGCESLTSVALPDGLDLIGDDAFEDCVSLAEVAFSKGLRCVDAGAFGGCVALKTVVLPDGVQTIGGDAFVGCGALTSVEIPASVETIGDRAFRFCAPELTLRGAAGSFAEEYAAENGIRFEVR